MATKFDNCQEFTLQDKKAKRILISFYDTKNKKDRLLKYVLK